jgi:hypothetical protein
MNEPAQFRVQVAPGIRDKFKFACLTSGVTMSDQVADLINGWLSDTNLERNRQRLPDAEIVQVCDVDQKPRDANVELLDGICAMLVSQSSQIGVALKSLATREQVEASAQINGQRHDKLVKAIGTISDTAIKDVATSQERLFAAIETRRSDWRWMGGAAALGICVLCALLWLVAGHAPGRWLAVRMSGADTEWQAAQLLAGNGSLFHSELMAETKAMLDDPDFRGRYGQCIDRAKASTHSIRCVLTVAPLVTRH